MDEATERELASRTIDAPPRKRTRGFLDVLLAVLALSQREQLHHFARKIFIRRSLPVLHAIEIDDHRRIAGDGMQKLAEVTQCVGAQRHILAVHELSKLDLLLA